MTKPAPTPDITTDDDANLLPMQIAAKERDRLARARLLTGASQAREPTKHHARPSPRIRNRFWPLAEPLPPDDPPKREQNFAEVLARDEFRARRGFVKGRRS